MPCIRSYTTPYTSVYERLRTPYSSSWVDDMNDEPGVAPTADSEVVLKLQFSRNVAGKRAIPFGTTCGDSKTRETIVGSSQNTFLRVGLPLSEKDEGIY
jgi:hypothetical protein